MKKKIFICIIIIILMVGVFFIGRQVGLNNEESKTTTVTKTETVSKQELKQTLSASGYATAKTTEKLSLTTTKYFSAMCVEVNDTVSKGENILEYTDGTYLTAPYDCYISELDLPDTGSQITTDNYVKIQSKNVLLATFNVSEKNVTNIDVGDKATIKIKSLDKEYTGYVTYVSNTASNSKFEVKVEFINDGNIKLGMSSNITIE